MGILVAVQRRWGDMKRIAASRSLLLSVAASGLLIAANWLIFIWAVNNGHVVETSLGYYLNPLLNVLLAVVFLREKPNRGQWLAIAIAGAAVLIIAIDYWIYLAAVGKTTAWTLPPSMFVELLLSGVVTALPLLFFARAAARMALSTLGFVQYIGPTIMLLLSVFVFKESVSSVLLVGFALIWTALVVYAAASVRNTKLAKAS